MDQVIGFLYKHPYYIAITEGVCLSIFLLLGKIYLDIKRAHSEGCGFYVIIALPGLGFVLSGLLLLLWDKIYCWIAGFVGGLVLSSIYLGVIHIIKVLKGKGEKKDKL